VKGFAHTLKLTWELLSQYRQPKTHSLRINQHGEKMVFMDGKIVLGG
jgi:hypothetical protein